MEDPDLAYEVYLPTAEEIAQATAEIRAKWSPAEARRRQIAGRRVDVEIPEVSVDEMGCPEMLKHPQ